MRIRVAAATLAAAAIILGSAPTALAGDGPLVSTETTWGTGVQVDRVISLLATLTGIPFQ
ncbi:hypothetical protein [Streptomyces endophyticus]|uniref:Uncharacterized protein n=1 Tax=Streptomyces endophyticus TaxID=714166 RepID=A0ABU6EYZ0_9ACTN|nr:hypothetical protein [Streptomyces endophyticus]MEB8336970.1 hypothetical protein [Streptomyces endophyticus]